jgi:hypothetical protein
MKSNFYKPPGYPGLTNRKPPTPGGVRTSTSSTTGIMGVSEVKPKPQAA